MSKRLTAPQKDLLSAIRQHNRDYLCSLSYKPATKLMELGYVTVREGRYGSTYLQLTEAGREALK